MSKISLLPDAGALDGTEAVPIVKGGNNRKTTLGDLMSSVAQPYVDLASNYAGIAAYNAAAASASVSIARIAQEAADRNAMERARSLYTPPAWTLDRTMSIAGNSISSNTGATTFTRDVINAVIDPSSPYTCASHYMVGTGTSMQQALDYLTANLTPADKAGDIVLTDPLVGEQTNYYDFSKTDDTFTRFEAIKALQTGGGQTLLLMVADPPDDWNGPLMPSFRRWKDRAQEKAYSADIVDVRQHIIDWYSVPTGFGRERQEWNELPLGYASASTSTPITKRDIAGSTAELSVENPLTLNHYHGEPITRAVNLNNDLYVHFGDYGAGENVILDTTHINTAAKYVMVRGIIRSWFQGRQGFAPFIPAGVRFRARVSAATNDVIGTVRTRGVADTYEILAGDPNGSFAIRNTGGESFVITRSDTTRHAIVTGEHKLLILAKKTVGGVTYQRAEFVRVMVMSANAAAVPPVMKFNKPWVVAAPRASLSGNIKKFSFAARYKVTSYTDTLAYLLYMSPWITNTERLSLLQNSSGILELAILTAANTTIASVKSRSTLQGGPSFAAGVWQSLLVSYDWENNLAHGYLNGAPLVFTGLGTTKTMNNIDFPQDRTRPTFGASKDPRGVFAGASTWTGEVQAMALWPGQYIDWATYKGQMFDGANALINTDPAFTVNGLPSSPFRLRGPVADLFAGGQDTTTTLLPVWRPKDIIDG